MKKNSGFTLVELLGIVGIIAAVLLFVTPSVIGMLKKNDEKEYDRFLADLYLATESYIQINIQNYSSLETVGGTESVSMHDLIENGFVKSTVMNPKTKKKISELDRIQVTKQADGSYHYQYIESN